MDAAWLASVPAGLYDLAKPSRYATSAGLLAESFLARPFALAGSVLLLAAPPGATLVMRVDGDDEAEALSAAAALFERGFDEDG